MWFSKRRSQTLFSSKHLAFLALQWPVGLPYLGNSRNLWSPGGAMRKIITLIRVHGLLSRAHGLLNRAHELVIRAHDLVIRAHGLVIRAHGLVIRAHGLA